MSAAEEALVKGIRDGSALGPDGDLCLPEWCDVEHDEAGQMARALRESVLVRKVTMGEADPHMCAMALSHSLVLQELRVGPFFSDEAMTQLLTQCDSLRVLVFTHEELPADPCATVVRDALRVRRGPPLERITLMGLALEWIPLLKGVGAGVRGLELCRMRDMEPVPLHALGVRSLTLDRCTFATDDAAAAVMTSASQVPHVCVKDSLHAMVPPAGIAALSRGVALGSGGITRLDAHFHLDTEPYHHLLASLGAATALTHVSLPLIHFSVIDETDVIAGIAASQSLTSLHLECTDAGALQALPMLARKPHVTHVQLTVALVDDVCGLGDMLQALALPSLTSLELSVYMDVEDASPLLPGLLKQANLRTLIVSSIGTPFVHHLVPWLVQHKPHLHRLEVGRSRDDEPSVETWAAFVDAIAALDHLQHVTLPVLSGQALQKLLLLLQRRVHLCVTVCQPGDGFRPMYEQGSLHLLMAQNAHLRRLLAWPGCGWSGQRDDHALRHRKHTWQLYPWPFRRAALCWMLAAQRLRLPRHVVHMVLQWVVQDVPRLRQACFPDQTDPSSSM